MKLKDKIMQLPLPVQLAWLFFSVWIFSALFAPVLANDEAIITYDQDGLHFPIFSEGKSNQKGKTFFALYPAIPYQATTLDLKNAQSVSPLAEQKVSSLYHRHWLGTDALGRDVLSNLIYGSQTALMVGFFSMLIAALIGLILGFAAALIGDHSIKVSRSKLWLSLFIFTGFFLAVGFLIPWELKEVGNAVKIAMLIFYASLSLLVFSVFKNSILKKENKQQKTIFLPLDLIIGRIIEMMEATPLLFLVVALAAVFSPSMLSIIVIIGITAWVSIAKFARAEALKIKEMLYIESAKALGFSDFRIILKHLLPNALTPIITSLAFGLAAAILIEASLSFIGIGISSSEAGWGQLLAEARNNFQAWWLVLFPGLAIFFTVLSCNTLGEYFNRPAAG